MAATLKASAAGRQPKSDPSQWRNQRSVKPQAKAASSPSTSVADAPTISAIKDAVPKPNSLPSTGSEKRRHPQSRECKPRDTASPLEKKHDKAQQAPRDPASTTHIATYHYTDRFNNSHAISLTTVTLNDSATPATPPSNSEPFYAFGWVAHKTRADVNEVCREFLHGACREAENCVRIHPRDNKVPELSIAENQPHASKASIATPVVLDDDKSTINILETPYVTQADLSQGKPLSPILLETDAPKRPPPGRGIVPYRSDSDVEGGQTSDSSQESSKFSPHGSLSSLTSVDDTTKTNIPTSRPPPRSSVFCRHWLQKCCNRTYDCNYVHGNLVYDVPVNGVYPGPRNPIVCRKWQEGSCTRGYLCHYFHGDLDYYQPTGQSFNNADEPAWDVTSISEGFEESDVSEELKESEANEGDEAYPPPKFEIFCRDWLLDRCSHGPSCFYYHGDVNYDPPVQGIHPPPQYTTVCKYWMIGKCKLGYACFFVHKDLKYDTSRGLSQVERHPLPRYPETCQQWIRNACVLGYSCDYVHLDLTYDSPEKSLPSMLLVEPPPRTVDESVNDPPVGQRPLPKCPDTCIQWLRNRCKARYACKFRHDDLEYDTPEAKPRATSSNAADNNTTNEGRSWSVKVHDHAKVKLGPGFDIQELETGFETPWIYLGNIPTRVAEQEIIALLQPFGEVVEVKLLVRVNNPTMLVRGRFMTPISARNACTALHGAQAFDSKITARLPVHDAARHNAMFTDTSVRIRWEVPSKTAYCGYSTMELAEVGIQVARKVFRDRYVHASVHVGIPVVGVVTIRFRGLPLDVNKEDMAWFAKPDDVVWAQPNYQNLDYAKMTIKRILEKTAELSDFVVLPPPYRHAQAQAWAHFATPGDAKAACSRLHRSKPAFTGKTRISAEHVQSLTFSVSPTTYGRVRSDIQSLCQTVHNVHRTTMSVIERCPPMSTLVKLSGDDLKELGQLKAELEKILNWETIRHGAKIAWDPFFAHPAGQSFLGNLERSTHNLTIHADIPRRMIRLLGSSHPRSIARHKILSKLTDLQAQHIHTIPLDGWLLGQFIRTDLAQLQGQFGRENVDLDFQSRRLVVRGNNSVYQGAQAAIHRARQTQLHPARRMSAAICPVCFDEVTNPVTLPCSHSWCHDCLTHYLKSSIDNKYFPLTCLGKNIKCKEHIPLSVARKLLTIPEFDGIVDAAYSAYVQARGDEFHYCPSPDCPQIYRRAPRDTILQCPSCLLRICPNCHVEAHDGFTCPDPEGDKSLFQEWMKDHDVKPCPGCKVLIERAEGCNHMTCTQCKTHICWVCLKTFPGGDGIYDHMRAAHGGIGLND